MRVSHIVSQVDVVGILWVPMVLAATTYSLRQHDIDNIRGYDDDGKLTREAVEQWLMGHSGDFSRVVDFHVTIGDGELDSPFQNKESERMFYDLVYPEED